MLSADDKQFALNAKQMASSDEELKVMLFEYAQECAGDCAACTYKMAKELQEVAHAQN